MKFLYFVLTGYCLALSVADDSVAMESDTNYQRVHAVYPEDAVSKEGGIQERSHKKYHPNIEKRRNLLHREREARGEEQQRFNHETKVEGPVYELPPGYELEGKYYNGHKKKYYPSVEGSSRQENFQREEKENLKEESSQYPGMTGSFLNHIKENMNDGKLLGYSSFVEHFSENDDAEELKTAMREGSLDDIKKLVPKSSVSFQMYHGEEEQRTIKKETAPEKIPEVSWNELNEWHKPVTWTQAQPQYVQPIEHRTQPIEHNHFVIPDRKKRMRKPEKFRLNRHRPNHFYNSEEIREEVQSTKTPEVEHHRVVDNEVNEEDKYPQIVQSVSFEIPSQTFTKGKDGEEFENERQESNYYGYTYGSDGAPETSWRPVGEKAPQPESEQHKILSTPKPPESSKLYYEHFKNAKPLDETSKFSQLPTVGRVVVEQPVKSTQTVKTNPETYHYIKKPLRVKSTLQPVFKKPILPSGEDYNQRYAQIPTAAPSSTRVAIQQPSRIWSKPDTIRENYGKFRSDTQLRPSTPIKLEKILNKQTENRDETERPGKENGNIFLTKEFQNEVSEYLKSGKSDFEWVPSTHIRYDASAHASNPATYKTDTPEPKKKKYRIYRPDRNVGQGVPKNVIFIDPENENSPGEFSVSASYQIDRNRKSSERRR